jgi:hypothetical protein
VRAVPRRHLADPEEAENDGYGRADGGGDPADDDADEQADNAEREADGPEARSRELRPLLPARGSHS